MKLSFSKKNNKNKQPFYNPNFSWSPIHPHKDWKRIIIGFVICVCLIVAWSGYVFFSQNAAVSLETDGANLDTGMTRQLDRISDFFDARTTELVPVPAVEESIAEEVEPEIEVVPDTDKATSSIQESSVDESGVEVDPAL